MTLVATTDSRGFSAVELLISIVVAAVLLGGGFQLYNTAIKSSGSARMRYKANNVAYEFLRQYENNTKTPCVSSSATPPIGAQMDQLPGGTVAIAITCPMPTAQPDVSLVNVTVSYQDSGVKSVKRSLLKY